MVKSPDFDCFDYLAATDWAEMNSRSVHLVVFVVYPVTAVTLKSFIRYTYRSPLAIKYGRPRQSRANR